MPLEDEFYDFVDGFNLSTCVMALFSVPFWVGNNYTCPTKSEPKNGSLRVEKRKKKEY